MSKVIFFFCMITFLSLSIRAQEEKLEIEGAIQIGFSQDSTPDAGTIRYNETNHDFEGWNGFFWVSLTGFQTGSMSDIDGNVYATVKIGSQEWMAENLVTTKYRNGDSIVFAPSNSVWEASNVGAYCHFENDSMNDTIYGSLYNWYAVINSNGLCPEGWHIPNNVEWNELINFNEGFSTAGNKLKEAGFATWSSANIDATNESAFTARPGGYRNQFGSFLGLQYSTFWWSLTEINSTSAWWYGLTDSDGTVFSATDDKNEGLSIRCIKD